jgi:VCBS repeat-containing protein
VTITIRGRNDNPVANADQGMALESGGPGNSFPGASAAGNVLVNDTDVDFGDTKQVVGVAAGSLEEISGAVGASIYGNYGSIVINPNGNYYYIVDELNAAVQAIRLNAQNLIDIFTYTIRDTGGLKSTVQLTITIDGANDSPNDIVGSGLSIEENSAVGTIVGQMTMIDDVASYSLVNDAAGRFVIDAVSGVVRVADSSQLNYEVANSHTIIVRASDLEGLFFDKAFTVQIGDINEVPQGQIDKYSTSFIDELKVPVARGLMVNDMDVDGDALTTSLMTGPGTGSLTLRSDGSFVYVPVPNFVGTVTFVYRLSDGELWHDVEASIAVELPKNVPDASSSASSDGSKTPMEGAAKTEARIPAAAPAPVSARSEEAVVTPAPAPVAKESPTLVAAMPQATVREEESVDMNTTQVVLNTTGVNSEFGQSRYDASLTNSMAVASQRRDYQENETIQRYEIMTARSVISEEEQGTLQVNNLVYNTVLSTGIVIWFVQGAQILATILAATPAWIQLDPIAILSKSSEDDQEEEQESNEGEKIFDGQK